MGLEEKNFHSIFIRSSFPPLGAKRVALLDQPLCGFRRTRRRRTRKRAREKREREREQTRERLEKKKKKKKKKKKEFESSIEFIKDAKHAEEKRRGRVRKYDGGASGTETESSHRNVRATTASAGVRLRGVRAETGAGGSGSANRAFKFRLAFPAVQNN